MIIIILHVKYSAKSKDIQYAMIYYVKRWNSFKFNQYWYRAWNLCE